MKKYLLLPALAAALLVTACEPQQQRTSERVCVNKSTGERLPSAQCESQGDSLATDIIWAYILFNGFNSTRIPAVGTTVPSSSYSTKPPDEEKVEEVPDEQQGEVEEPAQEEPEATGSPEEQEGTAAPAEEEPSSSPAEPESEPMSEPSEAPSSEPELS